ncbi:MAG: carbon-nitrogen family hydrolase, partial [Gemmatimonadetes bacterium]|nr:carbon-nitrogen family hydrolase [Gemmatimonadota bacterium]
MIVAGIQMDIAWEDPPENFRRVEEMAVRAMEGLDGPSQPGAPRLLVLPEMFATGFYMNAEKVSAFAQETREFLTGLASRLSVFVLGGYAEPAEPLPANACSIFAPGGEELLHYRKLHPFSLAKEDRHYVGGEILATAEVEGVRVTPLICYDLRFPEPFRPAAQDTDLYCVIANWPDKRREAWSTLLRARAIENQAYVLGVNRVGAGSNQPHAGDSALVDPMGKVVCEVNAYEEGVFLGDVDPREVVRV